MREQRILKVIVADDNPLMRQVLVDVLKQVGPMEIWNASNGTDAVELFKTKQPDVVFLDIQMPEKDGLAALKEIRQISGEAYVVMVSAFANVDNIKTAMDAGAAGFVVKPYNMKRILAILDRFISA
jgi:two-component system chemotaxis response regulator CheY